jgi:tRNA G18 (ribose-2'-O)-methylase SpoU
MDTFGFTRKKFMGLDQRNQNKHIVNWLTDFYHRIACKRINEKSLDMFVSQYNTILSWMGMQEFTGPESNEPVLWIEAVSDRIHVHRCAMGNHLRDHDLIDRIRKNDTGSPRCRTSIDCHIALDGLRSFFNIGSVFRICDAAGFNSVIIGKSPGKEHPGVQKTAMGAHEWVSQEKTDDLALTITEKKKAGFHITGIETMQNALPFYDMSWRKNTIIVFGNEEYGISAHVMETCDDFVHIPMFGRKNSINVANAVSIICFDIARALHETG